MGPSRVSEVHAPAQNAVDAGITAGPRVQTGECGGGVLGVAFDAREMSLITNTLINAYLEGDNRLIGTLTKLLPMLSYNRVVMRDE